MIRLLALVLGLWLALTGPAAADGDAAAAPALESPQRILLLLHLPPDHFRPDANYSGSYGDSFGRSARRRIATQLAHEHGLRMVTDWPMPLLGVDCYVLAVPDQRDAEPLVRSLSLDRRVAWAQTLNVYEARGHDDPLYSVQPAALAWRLSELHEIATGRNIRVAVVDSGVEASHPDLLGQVATSRNFVEQRAETGEDHGTGIAGIIGARADNGVGIAGVAPQARLMALRACWQEPSGTRCDSLSLAKALHYAITKDADVINLSLSGVPDRLLGKLIDVALARGIAVVAAADRRLPGGGFPAAHPGVIGVVEQDAAPRASAALSAPGHDVPTTRPGARWHVVSGASYAAAHVAGLLALLREVKGGAAALVTLPAGGIDACATLASVVGPCGCACAVARH